MLNQYLWELGYCAVALILVLGIKDLDEINSDGLIGLLENERTMNQETRFRMEDEKKNHGWNTLIKDRAVAGSILKTIKRILKTGSYLRRYAGE